jgi:hypothetical protein
MYSRHRNWNEKLYKASSLIRSNELGNVLYMVFERKNPHFPDIQKDECNVHITSLDM